MDETIFAKLNQEVVFRSFSIQVHPMKAIKISLLLTLYCSLLASCNIGKSFQTELDYAEDILQYNPDSALSILETIDPNFLPKLEWCQYQYIKTRACALTWREISWIEDMHEAATYYDHNADSFDGIRAGHYYFYSALAYKDADNIPSAIVDWERGAEILEKEPPCRRLYSTYENLFWTYREQMMEEKRLLYAEKMLNTARSINDSVRILRSIEVVTDRLDSFPLDSIRVLIDEGIRIAKAINDSAHVCSLYNSIAFSLERIDSVELASRYVDSLSIYNTNKNKYYLSVAMVLRKQGRIAEAIEYYKNYYETADLAGRYWVSMFLNDISKSVPGYGYLSTYADSAIFYNQKFDSEVQARNIEKAIADYKESKAKQEARDLIARFVYAASFLLLVFGVIYIWKTWKTKRRIEQLELQLQEERAKWLIRDEYTTDPVELLQHRRELLKLHADLFATTATYRDLLLLHELRTGEMVRAEKREKFITQVLGGFYEPIRPMLDNKQLSHEDLFLCLMTYMNFRPREIAACLGVSDDAVRQRKRRLKSKLEGGEFDIFFGKSQDDD